ncbi:hypothetical protein Vadar_002653 [Vaccinium darrowii]|uniref:Uncharacterized protein n=1 Tax=Vaccinium darrowii TaxID=229202 RepID=A0ACB7XG49_9ERIC|nr:hypothetical protein Vadar_002653 [Vaccinium darrowii]
MAFLLLTLVIFQFLSLATPTHPMTNNFSAVGFDLPLYMMPKKSFSINSASGYDADLIPSQIMNFIIVKLGTPPREYRLVFDTGSTVTWIESSHCERCFVKGENAKERLVSSESTSYSLLMCDDECTPTPGFYCDQNEMCSYSTKYADGSSSSGIVSTDTLYLAPKYYEDVQIAVPDFIFGCGLRQNMWVLDSTYHGVTGFSTHERSFVSQLGVTKFSYCFPPFNPNFQPPMSALLRFGSNAVFKERQSVKMVEGENHYMLKLLGISVGTKRLKISSDFFTSKGAIIIDTGAHHSYLHPIALTPLTSELILQVRTRYPAYTDRYGRLCLPSERAGLESFPLITFHFDGVDFTPSSKGIFDSVRDVDPHVVAYCLNFRERGNYNIFGMTAQVDTAIGYDISLRRISFQSFACIMDGTEGK